jgi:hypothetical protein
MWGLAAALGAAVLLAGLGGGVMVARAWSRAWPATPAFVEAPGTVVAVNTSTCGTRNRRHTCFRPIVEYSWKGRTHEAAFRSWYRPAPFGVGDLVPVLVGDSEVWLKPEWDAKVATARRDVRGEKTTLYVLGSLVLGCALLGAVLVAAVLSIRPEEKGAAAAQAPGTAADTADEA